MTTSKKIAITKRQALYLLGAIEVYSDEVRPPDKEEAGIITALMNIDTDESYRKHSREEME